jgi:hypothetical protein
MTRKNLSSGEPDQWSETRWWLLLSNVSFSFAHVVIFLSGQHVAFPSKIPEYSSGLAIYSHTWNTGERTVKKADRSVDLETPQTHGGWNTPYFLVLRAAAFTIYTTVERKFDVFPGSFLLQCGEIVSCCVCQGAIGSVWFFQPHTDIGLCTIYVLRDRLGR